MVNLGLSLADVQRVFGASDATLRLWLAQAHAEKIHRHFFRREELQAALQRLGFTGSIHTAFIERLNLTLRQDLAALTRRSLARAQLTPQLGAHLEW